MLVTSFESPHQIIICLKKKHAERLELVLQHYPSNKLKIITMPVNEGCGWHVDLDLDFFWVEEERSYKRCEMVPLITNFLRYVGNNEDDYDSYQHEYEGPPELGDIH